MNLKGLKSLFSKGKTEQRFYPVNGIDHVGQDGYEFDYGRYQAVMDGYGKNPYVFTIVNRICERAIDIPFLTCDKEGGEIKSIDPFFEEILKKPNSEGFKNTLYRMLSNYSCNEVFIVETKAIGFDDMTGFIVPNSQDVIINTDSNGDVLNYNFSYLGKSYTSVAPDEVLHVKRPDITTSLHNGRSNLISGSKVYQSNNEVWESEAALHKNKGVAGVLFAKGNKPMLHKEQKELQKQYDKDYTGVKKFGGVKVVMSELGYLQMGLNPNDLKSIESRIDHLRALCAMYNVDPKLFGDHAASTYNNMHEAKLGLIVDAVIPLLNKVMGSLYEWLSIKTGNEYYYKVDNQDIPEYQVSKKEKSERITKEVKNGILTPEEAREMLYPELSK